ncbi:hypothetical protein C2E23DRAFT_768410 [Lenzites betulinus]|nr:hypothetical protein C2E23DRAFT_768410 [Lenzites betulinus]
MDAPVTTSRLMPSLDALPAEILLELASYLTSRSDVLQLSQVSPAVYAKVIPALYADVDLHGAEQCERTLTMIERCPDVACHVRKLTVHPEHELVPRPRDQYRAWDNAGVVSRCVMQAAVNLDALAHFEWDGEDMLPDDRMWAELRARCACLKYVGTTFGCFLPRPTSNLFQFNDLAGFALTLKDGFYAHSLHVPSRGGSSAGPRPSVSLKDARRLARGCADADPESEPVFTRLWDMLVLRCPALEALTIVGHSSEPSEAARLYGARWPRLRALTLGALVWNTHAPGQPTVAADFVHFLEAHPTIESLSLLGRPSANQLDLSGLDCAALPNLKEFSGSFTHLRMLVDRVPRPALDQADDNNQAPNPPADANNNANVNPPPEGYTALTKTLTRVCFPHPMHLRDLTPLTVSRVLLGLHALTALKVTFSIQGGYDSNSILRTIVSSCPYLLDLDLTCANKPSFLLDSFASLIRGLTRLRTLTLALVRMSGEEPMHIGASRIALANPRLKAFSVAFIPALAPAALSAAAALAPSPTDGPPTPLERGAFELACDAHGIPVCLRVAQWRALPWLGFSWPAPVGGLGIIGVVGALLVRRAGLGARGKGRASVRRWVYDLRPSGHPDVARAGVGALLVERSPAGEEARLLAFCACLGALTVWALVTRAVRDAGVGVLA